MNTKKKLTNTSASQNRRVFVGLSGGVDSAVSAATLQAEGYDVTGVFIRAWQPEWLACTWREERRDAMRVALALNIPFLFLDLEKEYKEEVVDKMLSEYRANRTPNPDVLCNREIKFGHFWKFAEKHGADFIATGHYARVGKSLSEKSSDVPSGAWPDFSSKNFPTLLEGKDKDKDQTYFLWTLTQEDLAHILFPIGGLEKKKVRELAHKFNLPVAQKKDSQGICFMGDVEMSDFLSRYIETTPGDVVNVQGEVIGQHRGLVYYTVGERRGFEVKKKGALSGPFYIVGKDVAGNRLVVSDKEKEILEQAPKKVLLKDVNWLCEPPSSDLSARVRYRGEKLPIKFVQHSVLNKGEVEFVEPVRGLSMGQSLVFYAGENCLGGGVMDQIIS